MAFRVCARFFKASARLSGRFSVSVHKESASWVLSPSKSPISEICWKINEKRSVKTKIITPLRIGFRILLKPSRSVQYWNDFVITWQPNLNSLQMRESDIRLYDDRRLSMQSRRRRDRICLRPCLFCFIGGISQETYGRESIKSWFSSALSFTGQR